MRLIVFFLNQKRRLHPSHSRLGLPQCIPTWETQGQPREGRWGCELCTHGVLGGSVCEAMPHCTGPGRGWTARRRPETVVPEPVVTLVKVTKSLRSASLTISLSCSHLRPKALRVSVSAGRSGREGCVPAAQSRRMPEQTLGLLLTSEGCWVGLGSKAAHEATRGRNA